MYAISVNNFKGERLMKLKNWAAIILVFALAFGFCSCRKLDNKIDVNGNSVNGDVNGGESSDVSTTLSKEMQEFVDSMTDPAKESEYYQPNEAELSIADGVIDTEKMVDVSTDPDANPENRDVEYIKKVTEGKKYTVKMTIKTIPTDGDTVSTNVTMMKNGDDSYIETQLPVAGSNTVLPMSIVKKDGKCTMYVTSMKAYMDIPDDTYETMLEEIQAASDASNNDAEFVESGKIDVNGTTYDVDIFTEDGTTIKKYYANDELKRIEAIDPDGNISIVEFTEISDEVDESKFVTPKGYFNMTDLMDSDSLPLNF